MSESPLVDNTVQWENSFQKNRLWVREWCSWKMGRMVPTLPTVIAALCTLLFWSTHGRWNSQAASATDANIGCKSISYLWEPSTPPQGIMAVKTPFADAVEGKKIGTYMIFPKDSSLPRSPRHLSLHTWAQCGVWIPLRKKEAPSLQQGSGKGWSGSWRGEQGLLLTPGGTRQEAGGTDLGICPQVPGLPALYFSLAWELLSLFLKPNFILNLMLVLLNCQYDFICFPILHKKDGLLWEGRADSCWVTKRTSA